jgi:hypothetical protein
MRFDRRRKADRTEAGGLYCSHCGERLGPSMNFCPSCGRPSDDPESADPNARPGLDRRIAAAMRDGWELEHDFGDHVVMVDRTVGGRNEHLVVAALTIWWTMGLGNALYGLYRYVGDAERMVLRAEAASDETDPASARRETASRVAGAACLTTALALFASAVFFSTATAAPFLAALAVGLATVGLGLLPGVRRRLGRRRSVTTNGRARSVDEQSITDYDRSCAACSEPVGRGIERVYRKGFYVLGVPLALSEGRNAYCRRCANGELDRSSPEVENGERPIQIDETRSEYPDLELDR